MKDHVSFSYMPPFMCSLSCHMPMGVASEFPLESYCADMEMHESSATHLLNLVLHTKGFNFITNARDDGPSYISNSHRSQTNEVTGVLRCWDSVSVLCVSFHAELRLPHACLCDFEIVKGIPIRDYAQDSKLPFQVCISWSAVVVVLMLVCAFSAFSPRGRQGSERFYQGLLSSGVDGHHYPQGKSCSCLKRSLWYGRHPNAVVPSILQTFCFASHILFWWACTNAQLKFKFLSPVKYLMNI